jgi:hypothetical protein
MILFTFLFAEDEILPYISPGLQFGCNENFDIFISAQLTLGAIIYNGPAIGTTFGKRIFYTTQNKEWDSFKYNDYQIGHPFLGFGIGRVYHKDDIFLKYKVYIGFIGLLTYDYIDFKKYNEHNVGIFGVFPIAYYEKWH